MPWPKNPTPEYVEMRRAVARRLGLARRTHGSSMPGQPGYSTYSSWQAARARCSDPNGKDWARYGGRGITMCARWDDFSNFLADMGERPEGLTLDRADHDGNYEPSNCRWATASEQAINRTWSPLPAVTAHYGKVASHV